MRLRSNGVLIREDCGGRLRGGDGGAGVDCWDDGAVVLVFEEVFGGCGVCFVEGIEEGGVEGSEG